MNIITIKPMANTPTLAPNAMTKRTRKLERPEPSAGKTAGVDGEGVGVEVTEGEDDGVIDNVKETEGGGTAEGVLSVTGAFSVVNSPIAQSPDLLPLMALTLQ